MKRSEVGLAIGLGIAALGASLMLRAGANKPMVPGDDAKALAMYGCAEKVMHHPRRDGEGQTRAIVCIVYDPNSMRHFVVSFMDSVDGASTAITKEEQ